MLEPDRNYNLVAKIKLDHPAHVLSLGTQSYQPLTPGHWILSANGTGIVEQQRVDVSSYSQSRTPPHQGLCTNASPCPTSHLHQLFKQDPLFSHMAGHQHPTLLSLALIATTAWLCRA